MRGSSIVVGVVLLGACSSGSSVSTAPATTPAAVTTSSSVAETTATEAPPTSASTTTTIGAPTTVASPASGSPPPCSIAADLVAGSSVTRTMTVAGVEREYLVHLPAGSPSGRLPLVVDFHGAGSDMNEQSFYSGFDPVADREGFVVATPNGLGDVRREWNFLGRDDLEFARSLVATLLADACVDPDRVYAAGISSGSAMSAALACRASDVFHGFGLVAADFYRPALCDSATPRPMVMFHGTSDEVVPYAGGDVATGDGFTVAPAEESAANWAAHNGCSTGPTEAPVSSEVVRLEWSGCTEPVTFYRIVGGGHTWPGADFDAFWLGYMTEDIEAADVIWSTFAAG